MAEESLYESQHLTTYSAPISSMNIGSEAYVLAIACLPSCWAASASAPSNAIQIYDKSSCKLIQTLPGHETATTSLRAISSIAGNALMSSGKDGSIKIWDGRSNYPSIQMTTNNRAVLCSDISQDGFVVAAGTDLEDEDALLIYWDPRKPNTPLRVHSSTHSDDITAVKFAPSTTHHVVLSASSDGLLCTSDADQNDEDEAGLHVGNWGTSISQVGWVPATPKPIIWAASDMETFSSWSDELDQFRSLDIRGPSVHNQQNTWVTDYLISCQTSNMLDSNLAVFVGSNEGDAALLSNSNLAVPGSPWALQRIWANGHIGVVRSLLWDEETGHIVTGGEDSKINIWPSVFAADSSSLSSMDVDMVSA